MADYLGVLTELHGRRKALVSEVAELDSVIMGLERLTNRPGARNPEKADPQASLATYSQGRRFLRPFLLTWNQLIVLRRHER